MRGNTSVFRTCFRLVSKANPAFHIVLWALFLGSIGNAQEASIISFDAPGADTTAGDYNGTYPSGINYWGAITGAYIDANNVWHGFLRSRDGKFTTFEAPGADTTAGSYNGTIPSSINDFGVVAGSYYDKTGFGHGFIRSEDGKFKSFDVKGVGGYGSFPQGMNLEGAVVGYYTDSTYAFRAFLRTPDGKFTTWVGPDRCTGNGSEGCYGSAAFSINVLGKIVGAYTTDQSGAFVHRVLVRNAQGKLQTFAAPGAGTGTNQGTGCPGCAEALNQWGTIAGIYSDENSVNHGFVRRSDGEFTTFDAPDAGTGTGQGTGCPSDCPVNINDWGAITGEYIDVNNVYHGYLRSPDGKIRTVDPVGSTFTLLDGINDAGVITGYYSDANGTSHGFLRAER